MSTALKLTSPTYLLFFLALIICALVYIPGISTVFLHDDMTSIVSNVDIHASDLSFKSLRRAWFGEDSGRLGRPISAVSFAINHAFSGLNAVSYKITNLVIHLLNGILLWIFLGQLFQASLTTKIITISEKNLSYLQLFVVAAWLLHPINLTGVLYVVQRMTSLSAFFSLIGLICYIKSRTARDHYDLHLGWLIATLVATLAAALSKENGLLVPAFAFTIEFTVFRFKCIDRKSRFILLGFFILTIFIPGILVLIVLLISPNALLGGYRIRDFDLYERIITQCRVLWFYIGQLYLPRPNTFNLYHDSFTVSRSLFSPPSTIFAVLGVTGLILFGLWIRQRNALISLGVIFFLIGHSMESTIFPLEMVYEHRNYLPSVGLLLVAGYFLLIVLPKAIHPRVAGLIGIVFILVCTAITGLRATAWSSVPELVALQLQHRPNSMRANNDMGGRVYHRLAEEFPEQRERFYQLGRHHLLKAAEVQSSNALSLINLLAMASQLDQPIEQEWIDMIRQRLANEVFLPVTDVQLSHVMVCAFEGRCKLDPSLIKSFIDIALSNETLTDMNIANLLYAKSRYAVQADNDYETAASLARRAADAYPEPALRLHLANLLIALRRFEEAEAELDKVREADRHHGRLIDGIRSQEELIEQLKNQPKPTMPTSS